MRYKIKVKNSDGNIETIPIHADLADKATNADKASKADVADKLGTSNKGSNRKPIYLVNGVATEGNDIIDMIYPIGAVYISVSATSPASLFGGEWLQLPAGYALWTATSGAGNTISAGLPNITGSFQNSGHMNSGHHATGAFSVGVQNGWDSNNGHASDGGRFDFDASRSNSIYGNSTTVQPPAIKIYGWRRTN